MKFLRDITSILVAGVGMAFFLIGGGLLMLAVMINDDVPVEVDFNSMKAPISPVEKQGEN